MTTIIRRYRRRQRNWVSPTLAAMVLGLMLACALVILWKKGGPQPVHEIVIAIPAPQMPADARRRA